MNIYLAGRITGDPDYREKFKRAAARLWNAPDICVLNPAKLPGGMSRADYMAICLPMLLRADRAVFLEVSRPGERHSDSGPASAGKEKQCAKTKRCCSGWRTGIAATTTGFPAPTPGG